MKNVKFYAYFAVIFVTITWGISPVVTKYMLGTYSAGVQRLIGAVFAVISLGLIANKKLKNIDKSYIKFALPVGLFFSLAVLLEGVALRFTTPAKSTFYGNVTCIVVPVCMAIFARVRPNLLKIAAGVLCALGFGVIVFGDTIGGGIPSFSLGDGLTLLSGLFYGIVVASIGTWGKDKDSLLLTFLEFCICIPVCLIYVLYFEEVAFSWAASDLAIIIAIEILVQGVCWWMRNFAVRTIDAGFVAIVTSMSTIVSGVVSILTGMDVFTWSLLIGGLICVAAAIVSGFSDKEKKLPLAYEKS